MLWQPVDGDLEPAYPIAVTLAASSEAIDALLGAQRGSPRVVPDETKLAITDCASCGSARSKTFGATGHCSLLLVLSSLFVNHPFFTVALHEPERFSNACSLRRSRSADQSDVGNRQAHLRGHGTIQRFMAFESRPLLMRRLRDRRGSHPASSIGASSFKKQQRHSRTRGPNHGNYRGTSQRAEQHQ